LLFTKYKEIARPQFEGDVWKYLVTNGELRDLALLEQFFTVIGEEEGRILQERALEVTQFNARRRRFDRKDGTRTVPTLEEEEALEQEEQAEFERALKERLGDAYTPYDQMESKHNGDE